MANKFSVFMASKAYFAKQFVADIIAGDYDQAAMDKDIENIIQSSEVTLFSFTTCPFCRRAKDALDERGIVYRAMELDTLEDNLGNTIRAQLGKLTGRTSMPSIFVQGKFTGGCNDGPGLLPMIEDGRFDKMMQSP